jgi:thymidylate synthase
MMTVNDIRNQFRKEFEDSNFVIDRSGQKMIEILGASFHANEPAIFGTPNEEYIAAELKWYESQSLNINDIYGDDRDPPAAWKMSANRHGDINSNYGYLIHSNVMHNQFENVVQELTKNPFTRRASMIYTRPSIWAEYNSNDKNDFICTNSVTYYIRENKLHCVVQMRSNDVVFGYKNDYAWQKHVLDKLVNEYLDWNIFDELEPGNIYWQVQNLHVYQRHFKLLYDNWKTQ